MSGPPAWGSAERWTRARSSRRQVLEPFGNSNLNTDTDAFQSVVPTSENVAVEICRRLKRHWSEVFPGDWPKLEKIRIAETERNIFELRADEIE